MFAALLPLIGSVASRIIGGHHLLGKPIGAAQTALEGLGARFIAGFLTALYFTNEPTKHAINGLLAAVKGAVLG